MKLPRNEFKVPAEQWRTWSATARFTFNRTYGFLRANLNLVRHPKAPDMKRAHWETICWNAAWIAACSVDDCVPTEIVEAAA